MPRRPAPAKSLDTPAEGGDNVVPVKRARRSVKAAEAPAAVPVEASSPAAEAPPAQAESTPATPAKRAPRRRTATISPVGALPPATIPPEALASGRNDRLVAWTFGVSLAIHAVVLSIHFAPNIVKDLGRGPPLEVALVNAKTKEAPTKADILAQANLDGGGNTDQDRRAKSPLPVLPKDSAQNEISVSTQKVEELEKRAKDLLTQMRSQASVPVAPKAPDASDAPDLPNANEMMQRTLEAMRLEAQIAKDMDAYQKRPKRRFIGARAEEYRFARYVEDWRLKVERVGNQNYPEAARAQKLYGSLVVTVSIRADGSIEAIEVTRPSGKRILDAAAVRIVEMAAPYAAFPPDIRRDTDIVHITRTWSFTKGNELVSK